MSENWTIEKMSNNGTKQPSVQQYVDPYELKRKNANPSAFMSFGDDSMNDEIIGSKPITDIMVTFNKDPDKARKMSAKLNKKLKEEEQQKREEINRKIQRDFDRRAKKGARKPNPRYLGKKSPYLDPLVDTLPNGMVPDLPPVPDAVLPQHEEEEDTSGEEEESGPEKEDYHLPINPLSKAEVGEKFGIQVDIPKSQEPTQFGVTSVSLPKNAQKKPRVAPEQLPNQMPYMMYPSYPMMPGYPPYPYTVYDPYYAQMMYQQQMMKGKDAKASTSTEKFTPTQSFPSPYPMYSGMFLNAPGPYLQPVPPTPPVPPQHHVQDYAKQKLMEESGISISTPSKPFDAPSPTQYSPQQQQLMQTSGIQIVPREKSVGSKASLQIGKQTYSTHTNPLPSKINTTAGSLTIGRISDIKTPTVELRNGEQHQVKMNPAPYAFQMEKPSHGNIQLGGKAAKTGGLVIGGQKQQPINIEKANTHEEKNDPVDFPEDEINEGAPPQAPKANILAVEKGFGDDEEDDE